jgi:hypothetical protein
MRIKFKRKKNTANSILEIACPYFLQVPGTCWGVHLAPTPHPPGGASFWAKKGEVPGYPYRYLPISYRMPAK